ncbi:TonB-dependent receptor [Pseudomaricurvus alkylphenolicus]|uniref:TonB-dependent receptor n=1 Tax=Pseudomaricurvus alkylphenolicus TaxID=1306991 RepID=UPI0014237DD6|nr:TonB-dependent receptor [Pseudomaricurvus alkylphenolicus]NIB38380.1 TonB-dependent receptor [Pseudomaricurvus alkylphenolicus]
MKHDNNKLAIAVAFASMGIVMGQSAVADSADSFMLEEIVVTAQKRAESVQDIPIAVSAFGGDFVQESGITNVGDLTAHAPGLNGNAYSNTESVFTVRGVGTAAFGIGVDSSVGVFIDDIALGRPAIAASSFFDVERVEVVKGPQGTLFGRNTSAGAISVVTNKPDLAENSASVLLGAGTWGQKKVEGFVNWAVSDKLALRLAVRDEEKDGSLKSDVTGNELNNVDDTNVRLSALYAWSDTVESTLAVERGLSRGNYGVGYLNQADADAFGAPLAFSERSASEYDGNNGYDYVRASSRTTWDISEQLTLVSNTGFYTNDYSLGVDADLAAIPLLNLEEPQHMDQFSQEFRLNGASGDFDWFVGASYFRENMDAATTYTYDENTLGAIDLFALGFDFCTLLTCSGAAQNATKANTLNTSVAVYGDLAWNITENLKLTLGGRYSKDEKEFDYISLLSPDAVSTLAGDNIFKGATDGLLNAKDEWSSFDPRVALDYQLSGDILVYASFSTGYKSGGFNQAPNTPIGTGTQQIAGFDEEENKALELGIKSTLLDGRARLNASVFKYDYTDLQIENTQNLVFVIENAADATSQGVELDGEILLTENFSLQGNYTYMDAEFEQGMAAGLSVKGNTLGRAPKNSGTLIANYSLPLGDLGEVELRGSYSYTGKQYFDANNRFSQGSYEVIGARIGYRSADDSWGLALVGDNIGDEEYSNHIVEVLGLVSVPSLRSTYRLEFSMDL